jgi:DivIVA domain-containing protein
MPLQAGHPLYTLISYFEGGPHAPGEDMPLTPADVRNKQFSTTRLRPGYDEEEVDAFLDEIEAELDRLIQENEELRAKLAEVLRGGGKPAMSALSSPLSDPKPDPFLPAPPMLELEAEQRAAPVAADRPSGGGIESVARVLSLAQQTADQAVADARREAGEALGRARLEADEVLANARRQAEQMTSDAQAHAEGLKRDAQERHRRAMGSLVQQREELERRVDDLRAFEREYRGRLRTYLENQLRDLESAVADSDAPLGTAAVQQPGTQRFELRALGNRAAAADRPSSIGPPAPVA